jgi:large repetitive protein
MPLAVYTHVQWSLGNLTPGQVTTITYAAGIPLRENTLTWSGGSAPATTGAQVANLDNNNGPETFDEQDLENYATVAGTYTGPLAVSASNPVGDSDRYLVTAEDIRMTKGVSPTVVTQSTENTWTITIDSSEYRSVSNLDVTDTLPDGQCPLGPVNYDSSDSLGECDPTGSNPSIPYTSVTENNDGTWTIFWDDVATLAASDTIVLTFPSLVRTNYQES